MTRFLGILLFIGSLLLIGQCAYDQFRGETAVRRDRAFSPTVAVGETAEFKRAMAGHWVVAIMPALAGWYFHSRARRQDSLDMFSPDFKGLNVLEEDESTTATEEAGEAPLSPSARSSTPMRRPVGRILSVLLCLAYIVGAFASGAVPLGEVAHLSSGPRQAGKDG